MKDEKNSTKENLTALASSGLIALNLNHMASGVSGLLSENMLSSKDNVSKEDIDNIMKTVHPNGEVKILKLDDIHTVLKNQKDSDKYKSALSGNSFFVPKNAISEKIFNFDKNQKGLIVHGLEHSDISGSILAHEIGHSDKRNLIGKALSASHMPASIAAKLLPLGLISSFYGMKQGLYGNEEFSKLNPKTKKALEIVGGTAAVGTGIVLAEEARASLNARKYLKAMGKTPKGLIPAYGTYLAGLAAVPIAAGGLGYLAGKLRKLKQEKQEKNAAIKQEGLYADPGYLKVQKRYNDGNLEDKFQFHAYKRALDRAIYNYHSKQGH